MVFTSLTAEAWYSPAGLSRGQIRNVVKLPYNPSKKQRDQLYSSRVNPVVTFPGEGTILFGDKTALAYSSAFDRINVRKLFLVIEREIAKMSRTTLFELNDDVTRSLFKNNVNPYLRDVQAKRACTTSWSSVTRPTTLLRSSTVTSSSRTSTSSLRSLSTSSR